MLAALALRPTRLRQSLLVGDDAGLDDFWRGDLGRLEGVYREHKRTLERVARRYVGAAEAESVIQDVFVELVRSGDLRRRFTGGALHAWLAEIARRKALEHLRRTGRPPPEVSGEAPTGPEPAIQARDLVARFLNGHVPDQQRRFFVLRFIERRTQVEVARELGVPRSTLEGWEHRLADKLRRFVLGS